MSPIQRHELLVRLHDDAKLSITTLAAMMDVDSADVEATIAELEASGIIRGYCAVINWDRIERDRVRGIIEVKVAPQREVGFDAVAQRIYQYPEVKDVTLVSGSYDLQVIVEGQRIQEVARFVSERLATIEHVQSTTTHFVLKTYKVGGVVLDDDGGEQRLVISP